MPITFLVMLILTFLLDEVLVLPQQFLSNLIMTLYLLLSAPPLGIRVRCSIYIYFFRKSINTLIQTAHVSFQRTLQKQPKTKTKPPFSFFFNKKINRPCYFCRLLQSNKKKKTASRSVNDFLSYKRTYTRTYITVLLKCIDK